FGKGMWTVVGHFDAAGSANDSEMWCDVNDLVNEFDRQGYSAILARSADPQVQAGLVAAINADRRLQLEAVNERAFYDRQTAAAAVRLSTRGHKYGHVCWRARHLRTHRSRQTGPPALRPGRGQRHRRCAAVQVATAGRKPDRTLAGRGSDRALVCVVAPRIRG